MPEFELQPNPELFKVENLQRFGLVLKDILTTYSDANSMIERYKYEQSGEIEAGIGREVQDLSPIKDLDTMFGLELSVSEVKEIGPSQKISDDEAESEYQVRSHAANLLINHVCGYEKYMEEKLSEIYGDDQAEISEAAWTATWSTLNKALEDHGNILVAVGFFDELIKYQYPDTYDPTDRHRGQEIKKDTSARTFYEVMENHLPRAIMRSGGDSWS